MPDAARPPDPPQPPLCKRCQSETQYVTAIPKRFDSPAYEIFRCTKCGDVEWKERS
jgi:DNA-directed RNA polymerase subunit M/transcription elongation factor TFIIS